jgi:predicted transcriptional regulator
MVAKLYRLRTPVADPAGWTFVMLSPAQNRAVVQWLLRFSTRPQKAVDLWAVFFEYLHFETGEIMLTRDAMAEAIGSDASTITKVTAELEWIGAISRRREPRNGPVRYFMNARVATHLPNKARERAQAEASPLKLVPPEKPKKRPQPVPVE